MIFVTVGTNEARFDRLLEVVAAVEIDEELVVQHGPSPVRPAGARCVAFLAWDEVVEHVRAARVVVAHAGVGSVLVALVNGRRPVVMPRLRRYREAVDDHQVVFANRLAEAGLVTVITDAQGLRRALGEEREAPVLLRSRPRLAEELRLYLLSELRAGACR